MGNEQSQSDANVNQRQLHCGCVFLIYPMNKTKIFIISCPFHLNQKFEEEKEISEKLKTELVLEVD